jgi:lipoprotein-releasing system permease protein
MRLPFEIKVGLRYLVAKRKQTFLSVITLFGVLGVMLGVMTLIIVLGVMNGFEQDLKEKILGTVSHLVIMDHSTRSVTGWPDIMTRVEQFDGVVATTPYIYGQAMMSTRGRVRGVIVRGIDVSTAGKVISLPKYMTAGRMDDISSDKDGIGGVIVGKELAVLNAIRPGDVIQLISPQGKRTPIGAIPRVQSFRVSGIFKSGMYEFDANLVYMDLANAQHFFEMGEGVTGIEVAVEDIYRAPVLGERIESTLGAPFWTRTWKDMYRNLFSALKLEKTAMFIILMFIVLVAAFNIVISLIILVIEKSRDIAVLKAIGATSERIMFIFVVQGMVVGLLGTVLGALGGLGGTALLARYQIVELPEAIYTITTLPVSVKPLDVAVICSVAIAICFLATLYPSYRAAKLEPVEALRYE